MLPWDKRPIEIANLFNPAFLSLLLHEGSLHITLTSKSVFHSN